MTQIVIVKHANRSDENVLQLRHFQSVHFRVGHEQGVLFVFEEGTTTNDLQAVWRGEEIVELCDGILFDRFLVDSNLK